MLSNASSGDGRLSADLQTAETLQLALSELQCALQRLTSPDSGLYRRVRHLAGRAAPDEETRLDATLIRDELLRYFELSLRTRRGDCLRDLLADLPVPEVVVPVGLISVGVREVGRTAAIAALAALATDLAVSRWVGQVTGSPALDLAIDALMLGRRLLRQAGIDTAAETGRVEAELERRLQGALLNVRIRLYAALARELTEAVCSAGRPGD